MSEPTLLGQAPGYAVLLGVGAVFAVGIVFATWLMSKYLHEDSNSTEMFMVANRTVGIGLTTSAVYSSWTWATEFLWTITMVYKYGVMSAFWFGAGLTVQICIMAVLGIEAKKKIPNSHTCLEIVELRYGKATHLLFMFLCLVNNLLSCSAMILAASGAISIICGNLNQIASAMLIPFGVLLYTTIGGLKSTFLTDFVHSFVLLIILCYLTTAVLTSEHIGGISGLYEKSINYNGRYIEGNYEGSILTGKSKGAIFFGIIHFIGNTGLTVMDSSFWQKSFSADLKSSVPGYLLAAVFIFANVWPVGTIFGLANIVLEDNPIFPTYPRAMTEDEVLNGFGVPFVLKAVLGNGALGGFLLIVYLAVTSTVSAQMISVSSIISFDIYKKYIKPDARNKHLIRVSHIGVVFFGLFSAGFSVMLHKVGVDMTWISYFYSMVICPGVFPLIFSITWSRQTKLAAFVAPITGLIFGISTWVGTAYHFYGEVTIVSTGQQLPCLYGGIVSIFLPLLFSVVLSLTYKPTRFDWNVFKQAKIIVVDDAEEEVAVLESGSDSEASRRSEKGKILINEGSYSDEEKLLTTTENDKTIRLYYQLAYGSLIFTFFLFWVLWPMPLYRDWIWSKEYFTGYVVVGMIWLYGALLVVGVYPLWDGRHSLGKVFRGVWNDYVKKQT